jgi:hypothetical protein
LLLVVGVFTGDSFPLPAKLLVAEAVILKWQLVSPLESLVVEGALTLGALLPPIDGNVFEPRRLDAPVVVEGCDEFMLDDVTEDGDEVDCCNDPVVVSADGDDDERC